jgi:hypothetical protein
MPTTCLRQRSGARSTLATPARQRLPGCTGLPGTPPDYPVCQVANGRLHQRRIRISYCAVSGVYRIVRCTRGQKATSAFQMKIKRFLLSLGAIKGPPKRMELLPKHSLSTLQLWLLTTTLLFCKRDLRVLLSCNSVVVFRALSLFTCIRVVDALCPCVRFYSHPYSGFDCKYLCKT